MKRWSFFGSLVVLLGMLLPLRAVAATPELSLAIESPQGPVAPDQVLLYRIYVSNLNRTTPAPKLLIEANIPQSVGVNRPALGKCAPKRCDSTYVARFGNVVRWELDGIPAGSASVRELRVFIDNSAEFPPPADNTKLNLEVEVKSGGTKVVAGDRGVAVQRRGGQAGERRASTKRLSTTERSRGARARLHPRSKRGARGRGGNRWPRQAHGSAERRSQRKTRRAAEANRQAEVGRCLIEMRETKFVVGEVRRLR